MLSIRSRLRLLLLALATVLAIVDVGAGDASHSRTVDESFRSEALAGKLHYEVYLPAGYDDSGLRYPVVYFLHGLPAGPAAYASAAGLVERAVEALGRPALVVAPQGARPGQSDPEYLDRGSGSRWETAIAQELPRVVDARYRTIRDRRGRALIGLSAGGYGATLIALHHLREFSVVESWSGYFHPTDPSGLHRLDLPSRAANQRASAHTSVPYLRKAFAQQPTFFAFYVGAGDTRFRDENVRLHQELVRAGVPHVFRIYPGGHESDVWRAHAPAWLDLALDHLLAARPSAS